MAYWYPKKSRVDELTAQLSRFEAVARSQLADASQHLSHLSLQLRDAQDHPGFPTAQIPRWLWLASQYRLHAESEPEVAVKAGAALYFLEQVLERPQLSTEDVQDLNWVLEANVRALAPVVGPSDLRSCLSDGELTRIDAHLAEHDDAAAFDAGAIAASVETQMRLLTAFGGLGDLTSLEAKVAALLEAAQRSGEQHAPARAALHYLADKDDVVCDRTGVLGLIDDIYVIEWAYAAVESQTRCLPLLEAMLRRWPWVGSAGLAARGQVLDRYSQYVCCAALFTLFGPTSGALVLRETGPFPIIASVAAALEAARVQAECFAEELSLWEVGDPVTISDGTMTFHADFAGAAMIGSRTRYKLRVGESGLITVGEEVLPYISRSSRTYKRLSRGQDILAWLKDRNVDSLTHLTGMGRRRPQRHEAILLVGPRWKVDEYLDLITPLGAAPGALLGARWIDAHGKHTDLPGSATDRPLLYACADPGVAYDLVADPPPHITTWRIIVDSSRLGRTLHAALSTSDRLDRAALCVFADLHDREATSGLYDQGLSNLWYLEDQDVAVPPGAHAGTSSEENPVARFLDRQSNHWAGTQTVHSENDHFLEAIAECLEKHASSRRDDPALQSLDLSVVTFLRRAIGRPLRGDEESDQDIPRLTASIVAHASMLAAYDPGARRLRDLFGRFLADGAQLYDRRASLEQIASEALADESIAVVCRTSPMASRCREESRDDPVLTHLHWLTIEKLRRDAPYDRVIVPGWLDRQSMREIGGNGYGAKTEMLLLPFERRWYDRTVAAARRWERYLEQETARLLRDISENEFALSPDRWREQTRARLETATVPAPVEVADDEPDTDRIEARAIDMLVRALPRPMQDQPHVKAQLVLFAAPGAYALLPPQGQVIILQASDGTVPDVAKAGGAERQLFINVAALEPGMLLALPETTDRDLIDARADLLLTDAHTIRSAADLWKRALQRHIETGRDDYRSFAARMAEAGESRDAQTIRSWAGDTRSVAPRNYRQVVPLLATLTGDGELTARIADTLSAIDQIYRARTRAAELLLQDIFSGEIDLSALHIAFEVGGHQMSFALHRVERCAGLRDVPIELVGRAAHFSEMPMGEPIGA